MKTDYTVFYNNKNTKSDCVHPSHKINYHAFYDAKKAELEEYKQLIRKLGYGNFDDETDTE